MGVLDLEYGTDAALEKLLRSVDRPGDFCAHGRLFAPMPRLEVDGAGMLSFPVPEAQVRALVAAAERAPYGKGPDTLVDTSVRDCWQIGAERIRLAGGAWQETFARILGAAASGLGCPGDGLDAQLYKLLVYERGGFFSTHRDTEKADGMIATLSVSLPVAGGGGELLVRHHGREVAVDMNVEEPSELAFAAFYADCTHEIRPVVEGHRLSLVFNLCLRPGDESTPREAPDYGEQIDLIAQRLVAWRSEDDAAEKLVWLLDHEYSAAGLSFDRLKNADAARAQTLAAAAERAECELHAAIVHIQEHGDATYRGDYVQSWSWNEGDVEDMEIEELYDSRRWLDGWAGPSGARPQLGELRLLPGELLPRGALDHAVPDDQRLHEASGNEGVSLERAWRHAALVLWPRSRTLAILAGAGIGGAVAWVAAELDRNTGVADARIRRLASELVDMWPSGRAGHNKESRTRMLGLLSGVGDKACISRFLHEVVLSHYTGSENEDLSTAMERVGPKAAGQFLLALVDAHFTQRPKETLALLRRVGEKRGKSAGRTPKDMLREAVRSVLRAVSVAPAVHRKARSARPQARKSPSTASRPPRTATATGTVQPDPQVLKPLADQAVRDLFALAWHWRLMSEADAAAGAIAALPQLATPDRAIPAALGELHGDKGLAHTNTFATLWRHAAGSLLKRSATLPKEPRHWKIAADIDCKCDLCADLRAFCKDPAAQVARFPLRTDLRAHLHRIIEYNRLDIDHETERRGRPYTLVCTKNRASHKRRLAEYSKDVSWMRRLIRSAPGGPQVTDCAPDLARLQAAVAASRRK